MPRAASLTQALLSLLKQAHSNPVLVRVTLSAARVYVPARRVHCSGVVMSTWVEFAVGPAAVLLIGNNSAR